MEVDIADEREFRRRDALRAPDLSPIRDFLRPHVLNPECVQVLMEAPTIYTYPSEEPFEVPCFTLEAKSILYRLLLFLSQSFALTFELRVDTADKSVLVLPVSRTHEASLLDEWLPNELRFVREGVSRAYAELLLDHHPSPACASIVAALIAKCDGPYHYWASLGSVQSSSDVVLYLRSEQEMPTMVISNSDVYTLARTPQTKRDGINDIPLEYALTATKYEQLGQRDSIKTALVQVCKEWKIALSCSSFIDSADRPVGNLLDAPYSESLVYPLADANRWILESLHKGGSG
jgi:hypothetical protein